MFLDETGAGGAPAFAAVTNAASYEVEISRSTTSGGTYTVVGLGAITNALEHRHICNPNWFYKARVRARNAYGQPGTWTSLSTAVQPASRTNQIVMSDIQVQSREGGFRVDNSYLVGGVGVSTPPLDYLYTRLLISTSPTYGAGVTYETTYVNTAFVPRPAGTYYLWAQSFTKSGVVGPDFPASPTPGKTAVSLAVPNNWLDPNAFSTGNAGLTAGGVGAFSFLQKLSAGTATVGTTETGGNLAYTDTSLTTGSSPSGTWKCLSRCAQNQAAMWLRIS
jgi:hypothetical protein